MRAGRLDLGSARTAAGRGRAAATGRRRTPAGGAAAARGRRVPRASARGSRARTAVPPARLRIAAAHAVRRRRAVRAVRARPGGACDATRPTRGRLRSRTGPGAGQRPEHGPDDQGGDHHDEPPGQQKHHHHDCPPPRMPLIGCSHDAPRAPHPKRLLSKSRASGQARGPVVGGVCQSLRMHVIVVLTDRRPVSREQAHAPAGRLWLERVVEQATWRGETDAERLTRAFTALRGCAYSGVAQGVADPRVHGPAGRRHHGPPELRLLPQPRRQRDRRRGRARRPRLRLLPHPVHGQRRGRPRTDPAVRRFRRLTRDHGDRRDEVVAVLEAVGLRTVWDQDPGHAVTVTPGSGCAAWSARQRPPCFAAQGRAGGGDNAPPGGQGPARGR